MFNPVQEVALELASHYMTFSAAEDAQLLVWETDKDTQDMVSAMLTTHTEQVALLTDMTLPAGVMFSSMEDYQFEIAKKLTDDIISSQKDAGDVDSKFFKWDPRHHLDNEDPLVNLLEDLGEQINDVARHITLYFHPGLIENNSAFADWISDVLGKTKSSLVQYMIFDVSGDKISKKLTETHKKRVMLFDKKVNMNKVMRDTLADEQKAMPDGPEKTFQTHMIHSITALREGKSELAYEEAKKAHDIADENDWPDMQMTSMLTFGNALLGKGHYDIILNIAKKALKIGTENQEHPSRIVIQNLSLQAQFMEANAHAMEKQWALAADAYEKVIVHAKKLQNKLLEFEARRMAVHISLKLPDAKRVWGNGMPALEIAKEFPLDLQQNGTLPSLTQDMNKVSNDQRGWRKEFVESLQNIFGSEWKSYCGL